MDRDRRAKLHFFTSILCAILGNVQELQKEAEAYMSAIGCLSIKDKAPEEPVDAEKMFKELMENLRKPTESRNAG